MMKKWILRSTRPNQPQAHKAEEKAQTVGPAQDSVTDRQLSISN